MTHTDDIDPIVLERVFEQVLDLAVAEHPEVRRDHRLREAVGLAFRQYLAPRRQAVVWRWLGDKNGKTEFEIGNDGGQLKRFSTGERSVWWLWAAINDQGRTDTLRSRDFAAPGSTASDVSTRKALRDTAPKIVGRYCPTVKNKIALLATRITVEDGIIRFKPDPRAPSIFTR